MTVYNIPCTTCGSSGLVPRTARQTMDGEPIGEIAVVKSELFPATCNRCNGSGVVPVPPPPAIG